MYIPISLYIDIYMLKDNLEDNFCNKQLAVNRFIHIIYIFMEGNIRHNVESH